MHTGAQIAYAISSSMHYGYEHITKALLVKCPGLLVWLSSLMYCTNSQYASACPICLLADLFLKGQVPGWVPFDNGGMLRRSRGTH